MRKCRLEECPTVMQTRRGLCKKHYNALMKFGDPRYRARTHRSMELWDKVLFHGWKENPETGCWDWQGSTRKGGYGRVSHKGEGLVVPRVVLSRKLGRELLPSELALHSCDRPICVNPDHLRPGSSADNYRDMVERGRENYPLGSARATSKLDEESVLDIKRRLRAGERGSDLAKEFKVSPSTISSIRRGTRWGYLE